ncbi:EAL domain-containing protein [Paraferrimonas sp. SM1919]|uniref:EAL domain-containing protein n=1 Tax=Paraferrimonas sp. SM1919 TaxID=2662263 RepID=UPI0013D3B4EF|nr:EAL domain-containing protein [Paraferrimonas sp. SM1919]
MLKSYNLVFWLVCLPLLMLVSYSGFYKYSEYLDHTIHTQNRQYVQIIEDTVQQEMSLVEGHIKALSKQLNDTKFANWPQGFNSISSADMTTGYQVYSVTQLLKSEQPKAAKALISQITAAEISTRIGLHEQGGYWQVLGLKVLNNGRILIYNKPVPLLTKLNASSNLAISVTPIQNLGSQEKKYDILSINAFNTNSEVIAMAKISGNYNDQQLFYGLMSVTLPLLVFLLFNFWSTRFVLLPIKHLADYLEDISKGNNKASLATNGNLTEVATITKYTKTIAEKLIELRYRSITALNHVDNSIIVIAKNGDIEFINNKASTIFNLRPSHSLGQRLDSLLSDDLQQEVISRLHAWWRGDFSHQVQVQGNLNNHIVQMQLYPVQPNFETHEFLGGIIVLKDITKEYTLEKKLQEKDLLDDLTDCLNAKSFSQRLTKLDNDSHYALCFVDLEQFKIINESCGHQVGDRVLKDSATLMKSFLTKHDTIARLRGDQFALLIANQEPREIENLFSKCAKKIESYELLHNGTKYKIGLSVGVTFISAEDNPLECLKDAEIACNVSKSRGGNKVSYFDDSDHNLTRQKNEASWAIRIADAIGQQKLHLYYQEISPLSSKDKRRRLEILLRIKENDRLLPPGQFIAAAERYKLMAKIDIAIIQESFKWLAKHPHYWKHLCISINLSANSLALANLAEQIIQAQTQYDFPASVVCFEVTETSVIEDQYQASNTLEKLKSHGFFLALDDFGSGFASFNYLKKMQVDYVKIDGQFIRDIHINNKDSAIVSSIHNVCSEMGISTVAEFVESQEIIDKLAVIGIDYIQGYAVSRPQSLEFFEIESANVSNLKVVVDNVEAAL